MGHQSYLDTCGWCGTGTNRIQKSGDTYLCPACCPDTDEDEVPEDAPTSWHHMSQDEREDWKSGMSIEEIMEKYEWHSPPSWERVYSSNY